MILLSHPTGNEFVREAVRALNDTGQLSEFWTSVSWNQEHWLNRVLPRSVGRELGRRAFPQVSSDQLRRYPWLEIGRLTARQLNLANLLRHEVGIFSLDAVYRGLDSRVAASLQNPPRIRGVYAYEDGALTSFRRARQLGLRTIYELPIGYWRCYRELITEEESLQPEWAATLHGRLDSDEKLRRKDEELALATDIIVPSEFVRGTLRKAGPLKALVTVLPYGAPPTVPRVTPKKFKGGKLKVLFVGGLSQRKGLSYLLTAVEKLGAKVELTIVGRRVTACRPLDAALRVHRWIPSLSHRALMEEMRRHDVMVFPSLFEGFALVILEAMSQGVPVITTPNTAAPDFMIDGEDGFVVPIRNVEAIVERLETLLAHPDRLAAMSEAAIRKAAQHSWEQYRQRFATIVRSALIRSTSLHSTQSESASLQEQAS